MQSIWLTLTCQTPPVSIRFFKIVYNRSIVRSLFPIFHLIFPTNLSNHQVTGQWDAGLKMFNASGPSSRSVNYDYWWSVSFFKQTPLYIAVVTNKPIIVKELISCGADVNKQARDQQNLFKGPIHFAAANGRKWLPILRLLTKETSLDINKSNSEGLYKWFIETSTGRQIHSSIS